MKLPIYQLDAFADKVFAGNPAAVCPLQAWLDDATLQAIAAENNLSETAFFVGDGANGANYHLRWFTPAIEVELCGHATLASAHVIMRILEPGRQSVTFDSLSGPLTVHRDGERLVMDFPALPPSPVTPDPALLAALGGEAEAVLANARDYVVVYGSAAALRALAPDIAALANLDRSCVLATAPGEDGFDCTLRFFAPKNGIDEDPVTGSAHCAVVPYWADRLGKTEIRSYQASARGGELDCRLLGDRVEIAGVCTLYMEGTIDV